MARIKKQKANCIVCGLHKEIAYKSDTGVVCIDCAGIENGTKQPKL